MDNEARMKMYREAYNRQMFFREVVDVLLESVFYDKALNRNVLTYSGGTKSTPIDFVVGGPNRYILVDATTSYEIDPSSGLRDLERLRNAVNQLPAEAKIDRVILAISTDLPPDLKQLLLKEDYFKKQNISLEIWEASYIRDLLKTEFGIEVDILSVTWIYDVFDYLDEIEQVIALKRSVNIKPLSKIEPPAKFIIRQELRSREYQSVIAIVADFCSYTRFVNASGRNKELVISIMSRFYEEVNKTIEDHQAVLDKFMGDGVLFYWIVRGSFVGVSEIIDSCIGSLIGLSLRLAEDWQEHIDRFVDVKGMRCGGALGEVIFITEKLSGAASFHAIGDCINLAARLQATAPPNSLVVSNIIKTEIFKDDKSLEDISPLEVKNIGEVKAWKKSYE